MSKKTPETKIPSLADYLIRYDLKSILQEARQDYGQAASGGPRRLAQKDITARFRAARRPANAPR